MRHKLRRDAVTVAYVVLSTLYLWFRFSIINIDSLTLSLLYFAAECMGFVLGMMIVVTSRRYSHHTPLPPLPDRSVDVLVPTYREPIEIIRRTVMGARGIRYPHRTLILDDGGREEVRALAEELGVLYYARASNTDAKAGNLNFGLTHSDAEFFMVFDADHIAMPHAIDATLGFFGDEAVAMVQTTQDYYNTDAYQYRNARDGGIWCDQSFFFYIAQPCRDADNGSSCVGTGVIYRRAAIDAIGGIPSDTITEDVQTSLKLHKEGWRTLYLNDPVSVGIAEAELGEYYKTRRRWAHGNLHCLARERVISCKGLTLRQRISYLSLGLVYLEGWQQLLLFLIPLGALLFGLQPFEISVFNILIVLLFPFISYALLQEIGCGFARFWTNELFAMARWPVYLAAVRGIFGLPLGWRSSRKTIQASIQWRLMLPQITVMIVSLGAVAYALMRLEGDNTAGPLLQMLKAIWTAGQWPTREMMLAPFPAGYTMDLVVIAGFWACYNALRAAVFAYDTVRNARRSHRFFRFEIPLAAQVAGEEGICRVTHISETECRLRWPLGVAVPEAGGQVRLSVQLPAGPLSVPMHVRAVVPREEYSEVEGEWVWQDADSRDRLCACLYSVDWHRDMQHRHAYFATPVDVLLGLFRRPFIRKRRRATPWHPLQLSGGAVGAVHFAPGAEEASVMVFQPLQAGTAYPALWWDMEGRKHAAELQVAEETPIISLMTEGLDGSVARRYRASVL